MFFFPWGFLALRKTMLRAHRQAWAWQDEWHGLSMLDIREIERQTADALKRKMGQDDPESQSMYLTTHNPSARKLIIVLL